MIIDCNMPNGILCTKYTSTVEKSTLMDTIKATPTPCTKLIYPYELKINPNKG